ncbi:MAG: DEAD/DEAH box helicase, partial [Nitriliruptorales bacterium]
MTTFRDLGVADELCAALEDHSIIQPFPIQELTIPLGVEGADVIGQARTGTGKTLAFGLPLLQRIDVGQGGVRALVVTPTRELTLQVAGDLEEAGAKIGVRVLTVYGGVPIETQTKALRTGAIDVVVGTPGRLLDQYRRGNLVLSDVSVLVLDEADEMLDMGFLPDVETLIAACGEDRQTMLFSATMPSEVVALARRYMRSPTFIRAESGEPQVAPETEQYFFIVHRLDKPRLLARILQAPDAGQTAVFVSTKRMADRLVEELGELGVAAEPIHGDLGQARRERNLDRFRSGESDVLVATEVAARGLDIPGVTHVVNYDCPDDEKMYLHRIGRTGRAGAPGVAITFVEHREVDRMKSIRKRVESGQQEPEEVFSTSERLKELFDLPDETPWGHLARGTRQRSAARAADDSEGRGRESGKRRGGRDQASTGGRRREGRERAGTDRKTADRSAGRKTQGRTADASADRK